jgi:hypothetical protein
MGQNIRKTYEYYFWYEFLNSPTDPLLIAIKTRKDRKISKKPTHKASPSSTKLNKIWSNSMELKNERTLNIPIKYPR